MEWMPQAIREGIFTILFISGPLVILAAGLGLSVGIVQAATQVQEQTLGSAVKILGLFLAIIIFGFYMFGYMRNYATENISRAFKLVPQLGSYVLPRKNFLEIPLEEEVLDPQKTPTTLNEVFTPNKKAPQLADDLTVPDLEERAKKTLEGNLGLPEMQKKKIGDPNIRRQANDGSAIKEQTPQVLKPQEPSVQETTTVQESQPSIQVQQPQPQAQNQTINTQASQATRPTVIEEPVTEPKKRPRRSLSDSLNNLRNSIEEFNEYNKELEEGI